MVITVVYALRISGEFQFLMGSAWTELLSQSYRMNICVYLVLEGMIKHLVWSVKIFPVVLSSVHAAKHWWVCLCSGSEVGQ